MTKEEYMLMLSLIEKAKLAAPIAVRDYAPKEAPFLEVIGFKDDCIEFSGDDGPPRGAAGFGEIHEVYLPLEKMLVAA